MTMSIEDARQLLNASGIFFQQDEDCDPETTLNQCVNLSDTFYWAFADAEPVVDEELPVVAELYHSYGWCGVLYWVSEQRGQCRSEFADVNRQIEFVRHEERIKTEIPDDTQRAYLKQRYTIGEEP